MKKMNVKKMMITLCSALMLVGASAGVATVNYANAEGATESQAVVSQTTVVANLSESASSVMTWGNYNTVSYTTDVKYGNEQGSVQVTKSSDKSLYLVLSNPVTKDLTDYKTFVYRVYNPNDYEVLVGFVYEDASEENINSKHSLTPNAWTEISFNIDYAWSEENLANGGMQGTGGVNDQKPRTDITGICLYNFGGSLQQGDSLYFANMYATNGGYALGSFKMLDSAQIRVNDPYGIRFTTEISAQDAAKLPENAQFGTVVYPTSALNGATLEDALAANPDLDVVDITTSVWSDDCTETLGKYHSVLIGKSITENFPDYLLDKQLTAASYVKYTDEAGVEYTSWAMNSQSVSFLYVAADAAANGVDSTLFDTVFETVFDSGIALNEYQASMKVTEKQTLSVDATDDMGKALSLVWESSNDEIATVENGVVEAKGNGEVTITVKLGSLSAEATINVVQEDVVVVPLGDNANGVTKNVPDNQNIFMVYKAAGTSETFSKDGENGALKYVIATDGKDQYIRFSQPSVTDISMFKYIRFSVYNDSACKVQIQLGFGGHTVLQPNAWTDVCLELSGFDGTTLHTDGLWDTDPETGVTWTFNKMTSNWSGVEATFDDITNFFIRVRKHESVNNDPRKKIVLFFSSIMATME